jgi:hypothetical protein
MSNPSTRRVAQKIRGNHGLPIGSAPQKVNEFNSCGSVNDSGERPEPRQRATIAAFFAAGSSAVSIALVLGRGRQLLKPLATTTKAIPTGDDAELFLGSPELLAVGDRLALAE